MRQNRRWKLAFGGLLIAAGICVVGGRWVQHQARKQVTRKLETLSAAAVEIDSVRLGFRGVEVTGIRLLEVGAEAPPWISVERAYVQISIWNAMSRDPTPQRILVEQPVVNLRFDRSGGLQNRLSGTGNARLPGQQLEILNGVLNVTQDGREPTRVTGIDLKIRPVRDELHVEGAVREFLTVPWRVAAEFDVSDLRARIRAATDLLPVDIAKFQSLALFPQLNLPDVRLRGAASASVDVTYDADLPLAYRVELNPLGISVYSALLETELEHLNGSITFEKGIVTADNLSCGAFGGRVTAEVELNLTQRPFQGALAFAVESISLDRLPDNWSFPRELEGVVHGNASVHGEVNGTELEIAGTCSGVVENARILGIETGPMKASVELQSLSHDFANATTKANGPLRLELQSDIDVQTVIGKLSLPAEQVPEEIAGNASVSATLEVPLASIKDKNSYRGTAEISARELSVDELLIRNVSIAAVYQDGNVDVSRVSADFMDESRCVGNLQIGFAGDKRLSGQATAERVPLLAVADLCGVTLPAGTSGTATSSLQFSAPIESWDRVRAWEVAGEVRAESLTIAGQAVENASTRIRLNGGVLAYDEIEASWHDIPMTANATIMATPPYSFSGAGMVTKTRMSEVVRAFDLAQLPEDVRASCSLAGTAQGELLPLTWSAAGTGQLLDVQLRKLELPRTEFAWTVSPAAANLNLMTDQLFDGKIDFRVAMPLDGNGSGNAKLSMRDVDVAEVSSIVGELPVALSGRADVEVTVARLAGPVSADFKVTGVSAQFENLVVDGLAARGAVHDKEVHYKLTGNTMGGQLEFEGAATLNEVPVASPSISGRFVLSNGNVSEIARQLPEEMRARLSPIGGRFDTKLAVLLQAPDFLPRGEGLITFKDIGWDDHELATRATARVKLTPTTLQIQEFEAALGNGFVRGEMTTELPAQTGTASLTATRLDLKRLLAPWPDVAKVVEGTIDGRAKLNLGPTWSGTGQLSAAQSKVMGIDVGFSRLPVDWTFSPTSGRARVNMRANSLRLAGGRVTGKTTLELGTAVNIDTNVRMTRLTLSSLLPRSTGNAFAASGRVSGRLKLHGRNLRGLNDLQGSFSGDLTNTQAFGLPVLRTLNRYFGGGQFGAERFESTEVKCRLARGVIHIDQVALADSGVQLLVEGKASLRGRLDLNVTGHVGQFDSQPQLGRLLTSVGLVATPAAPVAFLADANEFLSNRLIYLHVGGTVRNPTTQLRAGSFLQQEAIRFFLSEATGGLR